MTCPAELTLNGKTYHCTRRSVHSKHKAVDYAGAVGIMSAIVKITWHQIRSVP